MYLPLAGLILLAATMVVCGLEWPGRTGRNVWRRRLALVGAVAICLVSGLWSIERNAEYLDPVALWQTVLDRRPQPRAHFSLGCELRKRGQLVEATNHFRAAAPEYPKAYFALGVAAEEGGDHADAVRNLREYVRLRPYEVEVIAACNLIGRALTAEGKLEEAAAAFQHVLVMRPGDRDAASGLAVVYTKLGLALVARDLEPEAVDPFAKAAALEPDDPAKRENLANALAAAGRLEEAANQYLEAIRLLPSKATLHSALGRVLLALGEDERAFRELERALQIDPENDGVLMDIAAAKAFSQRPRTYSPLPTR
jgi:tetratricopeptide (TPR) repeat protein